MDDRLQPCTDVILTELGDGTGVLLHLGTKFYFTLNVTGVTVWKTLERQREGVTRASLAAELTDRFRVDLASAARDLEPLVDELLAEGLVARTK
jgi:hypothetical protein